ncbi:MAG TPA: hypothetical protein VN661_03935 [Candidatus Acidoferrales bacterium]|nr:hypothetical protein [Candidatus Acidoferrales bacterium]
MDHKSPASDPAKATHVEVYWHTVKYRTVVLYAVVITAIVLSSVYLLFPSISGAVLRHLSSVLQPPDTNSAAMAVRQTRFVNLDGTVQVKKVNSLQWVNADYQMTLDTGDQIQAGANSVARMQFGDGTQYTVKSGAFVTVEENIVSQNRPSEVGVQVHSGQVDLATGPWEDPRSKAEVSFAHAVASLKANSRAAVVSDGTNQGQITVDAGAAELSRGNQHETIMQNERGTVSSTGELSKTQVLAPPHLSDPVDLTPIITSDPKHYAVHFAWQPVATAKMYEFQASTTTMFSQVRVDKKTEDTSVDVSGFDAGNYFWRVLAIDAAGNVSDASDPYRFTMAGQGKGQEMLLEVDSQELQGNIVQISGRTEPGAALMVNQQTVPAIKADGHFTYFMPPMSRGTHEIAITGQDRRGRTNTKHLEVVIP